MSDNSRHRWRRATGRVRDERGASMVEYTFLIALIAVVLIGVVSFFGPWVSNHLGVGGMSIHYGDYVAGDCPVGNWDMTLDSPEVPAKKNGTNVNQNGDNYVCVKSDISGNGNTNQNSNTKDNDTEPVDNG